MTCGYFRAANAAEQQITAMEEATTMQRDEDEVAANDLLFVAQHLPAARKQEVATLHANLVANAESHFTFDSTRNCLL